MDRIYFYPYLFLGINYHIQVVYFVTFLGLYHFHMCLKLLNVFDVAHVWIQSKYVEVSSDFITTINFCFDSSFLCEMFLIVSSSVMPSWVYHDAVQPSIDCSFTSPQVCNCLGIGWTFFPFSPPRFIFPFLLSHIIWSVYIWLPAIP